jgi:hypothetical protein
MVQRGLQERGGGGGHPRSHRTDENVENVWNLVHSDS